MLASVLMCQSQASLIILNIGADLIMVKLQSTVNVFGKYAMTRKKFNTSHCMCGCDTPVKPSRGYVQGHNARTNDNGIRTEEAIAKSSSKRRGELHYAKRNPES